MVLDYRPSAMTSTGRRARNWKLAIEPVKHDARRRIALRLPVADCDAGAWDDSNSLRSRPQCSSHSPGQLTRHKPKRRRPASVGSALAVPGPPSFSPRSRRDCANSADRGFHDHVGAALPKGRSRPRAGAGPGAARTQCACDRCAGPDRPYGAPTGSVDAGGVRIQRRPGRGGAGGKLVPARRQFHRWDIHVLRRQCEPPREYWMELSTIGRAEYCPNPCIRGSRVSTSRPYSPPSRAG